ncbi:MAG: hypothetical protein FH756_16180 [Firmicutes bacterium]|nr:hypothetical protein [Bacillota bacterium]
MNGKLKPYDKYKETELFWLDKIPHHWDWVFLSQVCKEQKIKNKDNVENNILSLSYGEIIRKKNCDSGLLPKEYSGYQIVGDGNIVLRLTDLQNDKKSLRTGLVKERGIITSAYCCLSTNQNSKYIHYILHAYDVMKVFYGMGGGVRQSIGYDDISRIRIPVPPKVEQEEIVRFLDSKLSIINKYIETKKKLIEVLKEKIEHYLYFENDSFNSTIKSWDKCFPEKWDMVKANRIFREVSIKNHPEKELLAVTQNRGVIFKRDCEQNYVSPSGNLSGLKLIRKNDFVISLRSFQGGIEFSNVEGIVSPAYNVFCLRSEFNRQCYRMFYKYLFKTRAFIALLNTLVVGIRDGKNISFTDFSKVMLPVPPMDHLTKILELITHYETIKSLFDNELPLLYEYRTSLISAVVTGKVAVDGVRVPDCV